MAEKDYSGTPLATKLGIKDGHRVAFVNEPPGFRAALNLPGSVDVRPGARRRLDVAVLFVTRNAELRRRLPALARAIFPDGGLWVAWPKKAAAVETDLFFDTVQRTGLDAGLVDNKSAAIDDVYQGLRFVYRVGDRR